MKEIEELELRERLDAAIASGDELRELEIREVLSSTQKTDDFQIGPGANVPAPYRHPLPHETTTVEYDIPAISMTEPSSMGSGLLNVLSKVSDIPMGMLGGLLPGNRALNKPIADYAPIMKTPLERDDPEEYQRQQDRMQKANPMSYGFGEAAPFMFIPPGRVAETAALPLRGTANLIRKAVPLHIRKGSAATMERMADKVAGSQMLDAAAIGALEGGLLNDDPLTGALMAAGGYGLTKGLLSPFTKPGDFLTDSSRRLVNKAEDKRYRFFPGEATGNEQLMDLDDAFKSNIDTKEISTKIARNNTRLATRAANKALTGIEADELTMDMVEAESKSIGKNIGKLTENKTLQLTNDEYDNLIDAYSSFARKPKYKGSGTEDREAYNWIDEIDSFVDSNGRITGKNYQKLRSDLTKRLSEERNKERPDGYILDHYETTRNILDDAFDRTNPNFERKIKWKGEEKNFTINDLRKERQRYAVAEMLKDKRLYKNGVIDLSKLPKFVQKFKGGPREAEMQDLYLAADVGDYQNNLKSAGSLSARDYLGHILKRKQSDSLFTGLVGGVHSNLPFMQRQLAGAYARGWPYRSGLLGPMSLPRSSDVLAGVLASRYAGQTDFPSMSDDMGWDQGILQAGEFTKEQIDKVMGLLE